VDLFAELDPRQSGLGDRSVIGCAAGPPQGRPSFLID
jgi:hypothetical protein